MASISIVQSSPALMGTDTSFVLNITNTGGTTINLLSAAPVASPPSAANVGGFTVSPQLGAAQTVIGASQFNVPILAGATLSLPFAVAFFGPYVGGTAATPSMQFSVGANASFSDGTTASAPPLTVSLNIPTNASPPDPASAVGALQFYNPLNSNLLFLSPLF